MNADRLKAPFLVRNSLWTGFTSSPREVLPAALRSPHASPSSASVLGLGFTNAAYQLLSGAVRLHARPDTIRLTYTSSGTSSTTRTAEVDFSAAPETWRGEAISSGSGPGLLAYVLALRGDARFTATHAALRGVLSHLTHQGGLPILNPHLPNQHPALRDALLHLADCAYHDLKVAWSDARLAFDPDGSVRRSLPTLSLAELLSTPPRPSAPGVAALSTLSARLERLIKRGGTALLVGPPGTFKTESAKRAAQQAGARLTVLKGAPGVEDRDFLGAVQPAESGAAWVDGPLTRAYLAAQSGKSVLVVDEALRFEAAYLNVFVGALDTLSRADLGAMGLDDAALGTHPGRFYALTLPSGEIIACPTVNLTVILTTNWGDDHLQTSDRLDGALSSRMDLTVDVTHPDPETLLLIFTDLAGAHTDLIAPLERLMEHTHESVERGGLYSRSLDARKAMALLREACSLKELGLTRRDAFLEALEVTAIAHCCPRDLDGGLNPEATRTLRDYAETLV